MPSMWNWLRASWDAIRTSLWLVPAMMLLIGGAAAIAALSPSAAAWAERPEVAQWLHSGSGDDARNLLSTLLTSVIAMASIAFSVTVVALSLAANTYGPRLIRIFRSDHRTQLVLGVFVLTIVYLLIVLRALRGSADAADVPSLAVTLGAGLAAACVLALLAFIQGVSSLMAADEVVSRVRHELDASISELPRLAPEPDAPPERVLDDFDKRATRIRLPREGYVQAVDHAGLCAWAEKKGVMLRLDFRPGDFVVDGDHRVLAYPPLQDAEAARKALSGFIVSGRARTPTQDLEFSIRHLVEIAVRALSPGINDPFTAMAVIDRLRGGMARLAGRCLPPKVLRDTSGEVRILRHATTYDAALNAAFNQIRQAGSSKPSILIHLLNALGAVAEHTRTIAQRDGLRRHIELVRAAAEREVEDPCDLADVIRAYEAAEDAISAPLPEHWRR
jgi:uncharacterized membrane protein